MEFHKKIKSEIILFLFILFIYICFFSPSLKAVGVRPLTMDLNMEPGETKEIGLEIIPTEKEETVELNLYNPRQQMSGGLSYEEGDLEKHKVLNWLDLPEEAIVPPGEKTVVTGEVSVPYDAEGDHTAIVMVEPVVENGEGITVKVRYAVRINIHVDTPGLRKEAEIVDFKLASDKENRPVLQTHMKNPSSFMYDAGGEVTIRDKNRQLIERVQLHTEARGKETTIYPGSEVMLKGKVTEPLPAGTYNLQLYLQYADGRQLIKRKTVEVGDQFIDPDNLKYIEVKPTRITKKLRKGGAHTEPIDIRNRMGDPVQVKIGTKKPDSDYEHSLLNNFELQLRGNQKFKLEGRRSERPVLIARAPRKDIKAGGYYDQIMVNVFDPENGKKLQSENIELEMMIGDEYDYSGRIQDLTTKTMKDEILFSATVMNKSDAHFTPQARVRLIQKEEIKHSFILEMAEEEQRILPEKTGVLSTYREDIKPGEYTAEVILQYEDENLTTKKFDVKIESTEKNKDQEE